jgi:hypothetical protein
LEHIKKLDQKVNIQDGIIAQLKVDNAAFKANNATLDRTVNVQDSIIVQLKAENAALKVRVGVFEDDNQVLREAIDGV